MKARVPTAWNVREESRGDPTCPPPPRATLSTPRLPSERRPHTDTTKVAGEALLAKAVEILAVTPVRRVTSNEVMGLHGTRRSDEGRGRCVEVGFPLARSPFCRLFTPPSSTVATRP
jgi:hypothetical protein